MDEELKTKSYFVLQRKILKMGGLSLKDNENLPYKIYAGTSRILIIIYLILMLYDVVVNFDNLDVVIDSIYHLVSIIIVLLKIWVVSSNHHKLDETLKFLEKGIFAPNLERGGASESIWVTECVTRTNRLIMGFFTLGMASLASSIGSSMFKRITSNDFQHWELPFGKFTIFNPYYSPNFELAWLYQSTVIPIVGIAYLATDFLMTSVFLHICLHLNMLRNSISRIVRSSSELVVNAGENFAGNETLQEFTLSNMKWGYLNYKLKQSVRYHTAILDLAQRFEDTINILVLYIYLVVTVVLGCIMYHGSLYPLSDPRFQKDVSLGLVTLFQLLLISYFGNEVTSESEMVLSACFEAKFFEADIRLQKGLSLIMARSQRPIKFTVGKFLDLSLVSFAAVVRAGVSYYMVLHNMHQ